MNAKYPYDFSEKVAVVVGGTGVLCGTMAVALSECNAKVAVLGRNMGKADRVIAEIKRCGGEAIPIQIEVTNKSSVEAAAGQVIDAFDHVDVLINGAGGTTSEATTSNALSFFDLSADAMRYVLDLNCLGTILCSQIFGEKMVEQSYGCIINISSMSAFRPLTRNIAYSAAKAAVSNFTQWLAVHISQNYSNAIRVNAIAPGFFITDQNRFLLMDEITNEPTERARDILAHTPMGRFGEPDDLIGTALWLVSDGSSFVNGAIIPVDGGFSAFSGV
jgi:NAD(P)-dependent dehydrogenase (short-subunit alcohol dehydrogenase family)